MRGIEAVSEKLGEERFRVSRLIDLERLPEEEGRLLLNALIEVEDLATELERHCEVGLGKN
jgi:hypothetical protein